MQASEALVAGAHSRLRRFDLRVVIGLLLMTVAVLGGASLIRNAQARTPVLVAAGPCSRARSSRPPISEWSRCPFRRASPTSRPRRGQIEGRVAAEPLWEGEGPRPRIGRRGAALAAGTVAITLLLPPESAVGGDVRAGDQRGGALQPGRERGRAAQDQSATTILLTEVPVLSVRRRARRGRGPAGHADAPPRGGPGGRGGPGLGRVDLALLPGGTS